ncbi:hypothetical protein SASPL_146215 [Salvia splendens]|uniref:Zeta-carotene desaturase n=1 Tax=Salvia splendens TaxID=180675 RepID=A0A8X8WCU7_SALSN|nr:hypothetical protein SASPL_146215 [Salvia splendens]
MSPSQNVSLLFFLHFLALIVFAQQTAEAKRLAEKEITKKNSSISAFFVFGDSTVDAGNNNYIQTISRSNFPPYGKDLPDHIATGRFTNGKLVTDFLSSYAGIKDLIPPYLDPTLTVDDLETGGAGELVTAGGEDEEVGGAAAFGGEGAAAAVGRRALLKMGAKKIAFVGLPPFGCVPAVITLNSDNALTHRACIQRFSDVARRYNTLLQIKLAALQKKITPAANVLYIDIYNPIDRMVRNPQQFGFENVNLGCCGSGMVEFSVLCNSYSSVCSDDSKYLFWDSIHPTQAAYYSVYLGLRPVIDRFMKD